jgi:hypothetical protein
MDSDLHCLFAACTVLESEFYGQTLNIDLSGSKTIEIWGMLPKTQNDPLFVNPWIFQKIKHNVMKMVEKYGSEQTKFLLHSHDRIIIEETVTGQS